MDAPVTAKAALLQVLAMGPGYGLELIKRVELRTMGQLKLAQGSVYPALRDLEQEGLLVGYERAPVKRVGKPRRYYKLTASGRREVHWQAAAMLCLVHGGRDRWEDIRERVRDRVRELPRDLLERDRGEAREEGKL